MSIEKDVAIQIFMEGVAKVMPHLSMEEKEQLIKLTDKLFEAAWDIAAFNLKSEVRVCACGSGLPWVHCGGNLDGDWSECG
jgi:hypothetical protein